MSSSTCESVSSTTSDGSVRVDFTNVATKAREVAVDATAYIKNHYTRPGRKSHSAAAPSSSTEGQRLQRSVNVLTDRVGEMKGFERMARDVKAACQGLMKLGTPDDRSCKKADGFAKQMGNGLMKIIARCDDDDNGKSSTSETSDLSDNVSFMVESPTPSPRGKTRSPPVTAAAAAAAAATAAANPPTPDSVKSPKLNQANAFPSAGPASFPGANRMAPPAIFIRAPTDPQFPRRGPPLPAPLHIPEKTAAQANNGGSVPSTAPAVPSATPGSAAHSRQASVGNASAGGRRNNTTSSKLMRVTQRIRARRNSVSGWSDIVEEATVVKKNGATAETGWQIPETPGTGLQASQSIPNLPPRAPPTAPATAPAAAPKAATRFSPLMTSPTDSAPLIRHRQHDEDVFSRSMPPLIVGSDSSAPSVAQFSGEESNPEYLDPSRNMRQVRADVALGLRGNLTGVLGGEQRDFKTEAPVEMKFDPRTFDYRWKPAVGPAVLAKRFPPILKKFFRALGIWHVFHVIMAAAFMYFSVNWVSTTFPNGVIPPGCAKNGTYLDLVEIPDPFARKACEEYQTYLKLVDASWQRGVVLYAVFNGAAAIVSAITCIVIWRKMVRLQPKDAQAILDSIFCGFPRGSFMISYSWKDEREEGYETGELPRRVARHFPKAAWLDIESLVPGSNVKHACEEAAEMALFRFAFISPNYFKSENCQLEWKGIVDKPGKSFIFVYPSMPHDQVQELRDMGHLVVEIDDVREDLMEPEWFLNHLVRSRLANPMFQSVSPGINEDWRPTLRFWFGQPDMMWLYALPFILGAGFIVFIDFFVAYHYKFNLLFTGFEGTAFLFAVALTLPFMLLFLGVYFVNYLRGTGYRIRGLPDVAYLLIFLYRIGVITPIKFFSNSRDVLEIPEFQMFMDAGVIDVVEDAPSGEVKCLLLDIVPEDAYTPVEIDDSFLFWTKVGFTHFSRAHRQTFGTHIIAQGLPSVEFLCCKVLMRAFSCGAGDLTMGQGHFSPNFPLHEAAPMRCRGKCRCRCARRWQCCYRRAANVGAVSEDM